MSLRRRLAAGLALSTLAAGMLTAVTATSATAHGATTSPGSRSYLCYVDGRWTGGDLDPRNPACQDAIAIGGKQPFWDWFGVLRSDGAGRTVGYIPDGQLCSGGNQTFRGLDQARDDWPATRLTSGADWTIRYNAWAHHPGRFDLYVTKDSYDPNQPLRWEDLEAEPFHSWHWHQPAPNGNGEYYWDVKLPAGKTGRHVIYSVWERSDSRETFYGCADVVFDGGNGEVIGFPQSGQPTPVPTPTEPHDHHPSPDPTTDPSPDPTPEPTEPTPDPTTPSPDPTTDPTHPGHPGGPGEGPASCTAVVTQNIWPGGYLGNVAVLNGGATTTDWEVTFEVPAGVQLQSGWHADVTQSGTVVTARAPHWNRTLATGQQVVIGFTANGPGTPGPTAVGLDGTACAGQVAGAPLGVASGHHH